MTSSPISYDCVCLYKPPISTGNSTVSARLKRKEHVKSDQDLKYAKNDESIGEEEGDDMSMKSKASKESSTGK